MVEFRLSILKTRVEDHSLVSGSLFIDDHDIFLRGDICLSLNGKDKGRVLLRGCRDSSLLRNRAGARSRNPLLLAGILPLLRFLLIN